MSLDTMEWRKLTGIKDDTRQTVVQLELLNRKMDAEIKLLKQMVAILSKMEGRSDADY